ncbi:MAG: hypothetical protein KDK33_00300 [Leptospiraceae bacterium]|nr:hypothetical protein [Leptospiraceae bacterium]
MQRELIFCEAHFLANSFHIQGGNWPIIIQTMAARMFKWLGGTFLISLFLLLGMIPAAYFIYRDGADLVQEVQNQARSRAGQLAVSLGAQASEATSPEALVSLCETMKQLVEDSQMSARGFVVEKSFLLDLEGRILAHNDVAMVAKDSGITYTEEKFRDVLANARRYPLDVTVVGRTDYRPKAPLAALIPFLEKYIPDLRAYEFHVAYAVYLPDADVPSGSLHLFLRNDGIHRILDLYWSSVLRTLTYSAISYAGLTFILSILLAFTIFGAKKPVPGATTASASSDLQEAWAVEEGAFEDSQDRPMERSGMVENEFNGGAFPSEGQPSAVASADRSSAQADPSQWPAFPGARPAQKEEHTRSHYMEDEQYGAPRTIDRDILDAIPLNPNGDRE